MLVAPPVGLRPPYAATSTNSAPVIPVTLLDEGGPFCTPIGGPFWTPIDTENFPKWAAGLSSSLHQTDAGWVADTPLGQATVRFTDRNDFGVLDHWVTVEGSPEVYIPLRLIANGEGAELELVLYRQPEMSDADFERDIALVEKDLAAFKALIEKQ